MKNLFYIMLFCMAIISCKTKQEKAEPPVNKPEPVVVLPEPQPTPVEPALKLSAATLSGTWNITEHISHQQLKSLLGAGVSDAERAEMNLTGKQSFTSGGTYESGGKMNLTVRNTQSYSEFTLNFNYTENGTWRIMGDTLAGTVSGGAYTAADEPTRQFVANSPQLTEALNPVKGETTKLLVVGIKPGELVLKDIESGWQSVLRR